MGGIEMKNSEKIRKDVESLREQIRYHDWRYYILNDPELSDREYDRLMERLEHLERAHPELITSDSPTQRVSGGVMEGFETVTHTPPMLSLDNTYSIEELKEWERKVQRMLKRDISLEYTAELKIDGVSCSLTYEKGLLVLGATRGDGTLGENVTSNIKTIKTVPLRLRGNGIPTRIEVRGEIYLEKSDLERLNRERAAGKEPLFANPRNAASGSLKLLDPRVVEKRKLRCFIHSFGEVEGVKFTNQYEFLEKVKKWGLPVNPHNFSCSDLGQVIQYCHTWEEKRNSLEYEIDGIVVKVSSFSIQQELGQTLKSPRWAVAYKFPAHQATTQVRDIIFSVGRTGIITPVAILNPVECGGVTISRATLHNFDEVQRLDIKVKDTVLVERAGEVIPKILKVVVSKRTGKEKKVKVPDKCPVCATKIVKENMGDVYWYCINPDCPARLRQSLFHFASRGALDIEGMGESVIEELVKRKMVRHLSGLYRLKKSDLLKLPLFAEKRADNLVSAIQKSKTRGLARFLYGLGIPHVGEKAARLLAGEFKTIDALCTVQREELERIPEIGPVIADSIMTFFSQGKTKSMIEEFKQVGMKLWQEKKTTKGILSGKSFVFTGELKSFTRSQAQKIVEELGGECRTSVTKNIDLVVRGRDPGSKYEKAKKLKITIIGEEEFKKIIGRK